MNKKILSGFAVSLLTLSFASVASALTVPSTAYSNAAGGVLRDITTGAIIIYTAGNDVPLGSNVPNGQPGVAAQPIPKFSAINTPLWISQNGPAQIGDDLVVHGLGDFRMGIANMTPGAAGAVNSVKIYDEVEILGNSNEVGNLRVSGGLVVYGSAGAALNRITGDLQLNGTTMYNRGSDILLTTGSLISGPGTIAIGADDGSSRHQITGHINLLGSLDSSGPLTVTQDWIHTNGNLVNIDRAISGVDVTNGTIIGHNSNLVLTGGDTGGADVTIGTEGHNDDSNRVKIFAQMALLDARQTIDLVSPNTTITGNVRIQQSNNANHIRISNGRVTTSSDVDVGRNLTVGVVSGGYVSIGRATENGGARTNDINMYARNIYMKSENGLHVEGGDSSIDGTLTVDEVKVQIIDTESIGVFYSKTSGESASLPAGASTAWSAPVTDSCTDGDKLLSCSVVFDGNTPPANGMWYIRPVDASHTCSLVIKRILPQAGTFNARPRVQCFSPDIPQQQQ